MSHNLDRNHKDKLLKSLCIFLCIPVLLYDVGTHMLLESLLPAFRLGLLLITVLQYGILCGLREKSGGILGGLMIGYAAWLAVTRVIVDSANDTVLLGEVLCGANMCLLFVIGTQLDAGQRKRLLDGAAIALSCVLLLWAVWAFVVLLTDTELIRLTERRYIFISEEPQETGILRTVQFFNVHRNESAGWYMCAVWLLISRWLSCRRKFWRIPIGAAIVVFFVMLSILHSRTVQVLTAAGAAMLVMIVLMERMKKTKLLPKIVLIGLAAVVCAGVCYKGMSLCDQVMSKLSAPHMPVKQTAAQETVSPEPEIKLVLLTNTVSAPTEGTAESTEPVQPVMLSAKTEGTSDVRNFWKDLRTLTMRTEIWSGVATAISNHRSVLLFGQPEDAVPECLMQHGKMTRSVPHTHNMILQIMMTAGALGALLMTAFLVILVIRMIRFFFGNAPAWEKTLTIPLTLLLINGMMEPLLTEEMEFASVFFMLIAGILMGCCKETSRQ